MQNSFSGPLQREIAQTLNDLGRWASKQRKSREFVENNCNMELDRTEATLASLELSKSQLDQIKEVNERKKTDQQDQILRAREQIQKMVDIRQEMPQRLEKIINQSQEEENRILQLKTSISGLRVDQRSQNQDVMSNLAQYQHLGLEFDQTAQGLRFVFTLIDSASPSRQFAFVLHVSDREAYEMVSMEPQLPQLEVNRLIESLNKKNNLGLFVAEMRKMYKESCNVFN